MTIRSNSPLPESETLADDLELRRREVSNLLGIQPDLKPVEVYVFSSDDDFRDYLSKHHPDFPYRRALFVKQDDKMHVYAVRTRRLDEDLRHEITHAYLHSVVDNLPLWLDEGLAEFLEVRRGLRGLNAAHVYLLSNELEKGRWQPDLKRLEQLQDPALLKQIDYAESWLWVHLLLTHPEVNSKPVIQAHLQQQIKTGQGFDISAAVEQEFPGAEALLLNHLQTLRNLDDLDRQPTWD